VLKLCRVNIERGEEAFEKIRRYTERVVESLKPQAVILFGSFARRDINEGSRVDNGGRVFTFDIQSIFMISYLCYGKSFKIIF